MKKKLIFTVCALVTFSALPSVTHASGLIAPPNDLGLVGYWPFDSVSGTMTPDMSGNGNNGTTVGSPTLVAGKIGQALSFNGTSQYVNIGNSVVGTGSQTISVWVKANDNTDSNRQLVTIGGTNYGFALSQVGSIWQGQVVTTNPGTVQYNALGSSIVVGVWTHEVVVFDNTAQTISIYTNGKLVTTTTGTGQTVRGNGTVVIGAFAGPVDFFNGSIDDARIYNRALSASDIQQLYHEGAVTHGASPTSLIPNGLVGYWTFDGQNTNWNTDTTADVSGKGNTGKLINMSTTTSPVLGRFGQALSFNGTSQYVSIPNSTSVNMGGATSFSLSAWVNFSSFSTTNCNAQFLIAKGQDTGSYVGFYGLDVGDTGGCGASTGVKNVGLVFTPSSGTQSNLTAIVPGNLSTGKWYLITGTYNGTILSVYVNGVNIGSQSATGANGSNTDYVSIGGAPLDIAGYQYYTHGSIDDVRIYNRALSASEVQQLYYQTQGTHGGPF